MWFPWFSFLTTGGQSLSEFGFIRMGTGDSYVEGRGNVRPKDESG